jgi:hypothetical protein
VAGVAREVAFPLHEFVQALGVARERVRQLANLVVGVARQAGRVELGRVWSRGIELAHLSRQCDDWRERAA